jgi:hypothetical protein
VIWKSFPACPILKKALPDSDIVHDRHIAALLKERVDRIERRLESS